jgi:hypothetical protein
MASEELSSSGSRHAQEPLGVSRWAVEGNPNSSTPDQGKGSNERATWTICGRTFRCQRNSGQGQTTVLLAAARE